MKIKYIVSALCLAALMVGCQKEGGNSGQSGEGFKLSATSQPQTRTSIGADGLTVKWESDDVVKLVSVSGTTSYDFKVAQGSISADGTKADFELQSGGTVAAGTYRVVYGQSATATASDVQFSFGDVSTTHAAKDNAKGALKYKYMYSDVITVSEGATSASAPMNHASAMLKLPVTLSSNATGGAVTLTSVTVSDKNSSPVFSLEHNMNKSTGAVTPNGARMAASMAVTFTDTPELTVGTAYTVYLPIPPTTVSDATVKISTSAGDFSFDKAGKTFEAGYQYEVTGLTFDAVGASTNVGNVTDWNNAMQGASAPVTVTLTADVTLDENAVFPTYPVTVNGPYKLIVDASSSVGPIDASADKVIATANPTRKVTTTVGFVGGADLVVNGGILYASDVILGNGSSISGTGRLVLSGNLTVEPQATATIADGFIASCAGLYNDGTLTGGTVYYGTVAGTTPDNAVSKAAAQLPYSGFDKWYRTKIYLILSSLGKQGWFVGETSGSADNVWQSGNGNSTKASKGGLAMAGDDANPTRPDGTNKVAGDYSLQMVSSWVTISGVGKFAAGNLFTGTYENTIISSGSASMNFGVSYTHKPVAFSGYYKYTSGNIDYDGKKLDTPLEEKDACDIYVAISKKVYNVDTNNADSYPGLTANDLSADPDIVAYGRLTSSEEVSGAYGNGFKKFRIELTYKSDDFNPSDANYVIISASSSKDGSTFKGSSAANLWLDEVEFEF